MFINLPSEIQLQTELENPWIQRASESAKGLRSVHNCCRWVEIRMIRQVEGFSPKLYRGVFGDSCVLDQRKIKIR